MNAPLFPRLNRATATALWEEMAELSIKKLGEQAGSTHPQAFYAQTGGARVPERQISALRKQVLDIARAHGFPKPGTAKGWRGPFDRSCAQFLATRAGIPLGEALRPETWSFLTLVVLPDVARWCFPKEKKKNGGSQPLDQPRSVSAAEIGRMRGGGRNVFQRLWRRGHLLAVRNGEQLDWTLLNALTEDAFVAVLERPGTSSNPRVAQAIAHAWVETAERVGRPKMEGIHRDAMKRITAAGAVRRLDALDDSALAQLMIGSFAAAARGIPSVASLTASHPALPARGTGLSTSRGLGSASSSGSLSSVTNESTRRAQATDDWPQWALQLPNDQTRRIFLSLVKGKVLSDKRLRRYLSEREFHEFREQFARLSAGLPFRLCERTTAEGRQFLCRMYKLRQPDGHDAPSPTKGTLGGHRKLKIYGRLDCRKAISRFPEHLRYRVFFADERAAIRAGFRPCEACMVDEYCRWADGGAPGSQGYPWLVAPD